MKSSGTIKRGLAATAIAALAVAGIPALAGTANAVVGNVTVTALGAYDVDELVGASNDITVNVVETGGGPTVGQAVEYRTIFTPQGPGAPVDSGFVANAGVTDAFGNVPLNFHPTLSGSYWISVRAAGSPVHATPFTVVVGESEITWADGASAPSPVGGTDTYTATLALTDAAQTPLPGRTITIELTGEDDAGFGPQTPPSMQVDADSATSTSGADGRFTVSLTDPVTIPSVAEDAVLTATAPALKGAGDSASADASRALTVEFGAVVVKAVEVTTRNVFTGTPAPGKPVELDIRVTSEGPTLAANDDVVLKDYPVSVIVNRGFLTPDTQGAGFNVDPTELALTTDQDDLGDLFGYYQSLGPNEALETSDNVGNNNAASVVATIEKDTGFDDDGRVAQTVTVTAGGKTDTATINYDSRNYLNLPSASFARASGSTQVPGPIDLKLYAVDQFRNLVGGEAAVITDDSPVGLVNIEAGGARSDYTNDNPSVRASSPQAVAQTVTATLKGDAAKVDASGNPVFTLDSDTIATNHVILWTGSTPPPVTPITATIRATNKGSLDRLMIKTNPAVPDAQVRLYKKVGNRSILIGAKRANAKGVKIFLKPDRNGGRFTTYFAIVAKSPTTRQDRTENIALR